MTCRHRHASGARCGVTLGGPRVSAGGRYCGHHARFHVGRIVTVDVHAGCTVTYNDASGLATYVSDESCPTQPEAVADARRATEDAIERCERRLRDLRAVRGALLNTIEDGG